MATGTIKKVVPERGFGFIAAEDEKEYFFHLSGVDSSLDFERLIGGERGLDPAEPSNGSTARSGRFFLSPSRAAAQARPAAASIARAPLLTNAPSDPSPMKRKPRSR